MTCRDQMVTRFRRCVPHQRLLDALEILGEDGADWVAVVAGHDDPSFVGWITAQAAAVFLAAFDKRPSEVMCRELVSAPPEVLAPEQDLERALAAITASGYRRLPVVEGGRLIGILGAGSRPG
ncbi:MAG: CBS domain-containing protein [Terriglobales bacterium]